MALLDYVNQNPEVVQDNQVTEPVTTPVVTPETTPVATPVVDNPAVAEPIKEPEIETIDIDGIKVPIAEIKQGYLRQSDYTKKTQELAQQRQEAKDALELVEYLRKNPEIARKLVEENPTASVTKTPTIDNAANPWKQDIAEMKQQMYLTQIDGDIAKLKAKYPDFNEVEVLNKATELQVPDLEFVYNAMRGQKLDSIIQTKINEALANAQTQAQKEGVISKTLISGTDTTPVATTTLTDSQKRMAAKLDMTEEEYIKWL